MLPHFETTSKVYESLVHCIIKKVKETSHQVYFT